MSIKNLIIALIFTASTCFAFSNSYTDNPTLDLLFSKIESIDTSKIYETVEIYENDDINPIKPVSELSCSTVKGIDWIKGDLEYLTYSTIFRFPTKREVKAFARHFNSSYKQCSNVIRENGEVVLEEYHYIASDNSTALYFKMVPVTRED
jgi:hypothetical protein